MSELGPLPETVIELDEAYPGLALADQVRAERERCYALGVAAERERLTAQFEARIADKFVGTEDTMIWLQALRMVKR